jgi:transcriptional regulator of arginine metabolism
MIGKQLRQEKISLIIRGKGVRNQESLLAKLVQEGVQTTQSTLSRDLAELGVFKADGAYRMPQVAAGESSLVDLLDLQWAGDHLLVLKTAPGEAAIVALTIDREQLEEVVGTVAGDDTIFVAVRGVQERKKAARKILELFK